jgi:hypothetical protein
MDYDYSEYNFFRPKNVPNDFNTSYYYDGRMASRPVNPFDIESRRNQCSPMQPTYTPTNGAYNYAPYQQTNIPADSRRNDTVGNLNTDLFRQQQAYSQPINMQPPMQPMAPMQPQRQMYMGYTPVSQFDNMYTRPPRPQDTYVNWYDVNHKANQPVEPYPAYQYTGAYPQPGRAPMSEMDWSAIVKKNFAMQNL